MKPNLFKYATSELSQDALICWLIEWADDKYAENDNHLNQVAQRFVDELIGEKMLKYEIFVDKQLKNIDVYAIINNTYFIVIEDKKGTSEHSNQLQKYFNFVKENKDWAHLEDIKLVYFKMEEQSDFSEVEGAKFVHFDRAKMLKVLKTYFDSVPEKLQNHILQDFHIDLLRLDDEISSFRKLPVEKWEYYSWMGFFHNLQKELHEFKPRWSYVSNASGGFLGFFWNWITPKANTPTFYLQIEETGLLTFRLESEDVELNRKYRNIFINSLQNVANQKQIILSSYGGRGKVGKTMGVLKLGESFIKTDKNGLIDFSATVDFIKNITKTMTDSVEKMSHNDFIIKEF